MFEGQDVLPLNSKTNRLFIHPSSSVFVSFAVFPFCLSLVIPEKHLIIPWHLQFLPPFFSWLSSSSPDAIVRQLNSCHLIISPNATEEEEDISEMQTSQSARWAEEEGEDEMRAVSRNSYFLWMSVLLRRASCLYVMTIPEDPLQNEKKKKKPSIFVWFLWSSSAAATKGCRLVVVATNSILFPSDSTLHHLLVWLAGWSSTSSSNCLAECATRKVSLNNSIAVESTVSSKHGKYGPPVPPSFNRSGYSSRLLELLVWTSGAILLLLLSLSCLNLLFTVPF